MVTEETGVIEYTTAGQIATAFQAAKKRIERAANELQQAYADLNKQIENTSIRVDPPRIVLCGRVDTDDADLLIAKAKMQVWAGLIDKLNIRKVMSSKRSEELSKLLHSQDYGWAAAQLPDITPETILDVLSGMAQGVEEFLKEAVLEEYDYWKPMRRSDYKTNQKSVDSGKLERKVIRWVGDHRWLDSRHAAHIRAISNIMSMLDGKGACKGYRCEIEDAISAGNDAGETPYFTWKRFGNGNLHLTFRRQDLLDKFNAICGRNRLAGDTSQLYRDYQAGRWD
jgi:hypothetical protein